MGELRCPSLDYVYRMTWAEFRLRLISFNRQQESEMYKLRRLAWITYIAPHQDPKKIRGMKEDVWWKIGKKQISRASEASKQKFLQEYKEYLKKTKHGKA